MDIPHQRISLGIHGRDGEAKSARHCWDWRILIDITVALTLAYTLPEVFYFLEARAEELVSRRVFFWSSGSIIEM